jgi:hypothetical protein
MKWALGGAAVGGQLGVDVPAIAVVLTGRLVGIDLERSCCEFGLGPHR